jgi:erythronate-4-phosphate dehydrogenase
MEGEDCTHHMVNQAFAGGLQKRPLLINTCRGEVFESEAVHRARETGEIAGLIIDCWENEPALDVNLLHRVDFGTPHIAGYSRDGKANGTTVAVRAISKFFGLGIDDWEPTGIEPPENPVIELDGAHQEEEAVLAKAVLSTYRIAVDDAALRDNPSLFEQLRGDYPARREFDSYLVNAVNVDPVILKKLEKLGFRLQEKEHHREP